MLGIRSVEGFKSFGYLIMGKKVNAPKEDATLDFLVLKAQRQLALLLEGFDEAKKTSHIHLGVTTFLFTVVLGVINEFKTEWYALLFVLPILGLLVSFYKIVNNLYSVRLLSGKKIEWYREMLDKPIIELKEVEIADNFRAIEVIRIETMVKNKVIKHVGFINFYALLSIIVLVIIHVILNIHKI